MCWSARSHFFVPGTEPGVPVPPGRLFSEQMRVIAKQSDRISSAIGKFYGKVLQEPKSKFQVLYLVIWHCLSVLHLVLF